MQKVQTANPKLRTPKMGENTRLELPPNQRKGPPTEKQEEKTARRCERKEEVVRKGRKDTMLHKQECQGSPWMQVPRPVDCPRLSLEKKHHAYRLMSAYAPAMA